MVLMFSQIFFLQKMHFHSLNEFVSFAVLYNGRAHVGCQIDAERTYYSNLGFLLNT